jgi:hypothetical protein
MQYSYIQKKNLTEISVFHCDCENLPDGQSGWAMGICSWVWMYSLPVLLGYLNAVLKLLIDTEM